MRYKFEGKCTQEGNRHFIEIPFNVWEVCEQKGNIPVEVTIEQISFECKLIPKGQGWYYIPLIKKYLTQLPEKTAIRLPLAFSINYRESIMIVPTPLQFGRLIRSILFCSLTMDYADKLASQC